MDITLYNVPPYLCNTIKNNLSTIIKKYLIKNEIDTSNPKTYMKIQKIRIVLVKIFTCKKSSTRVHF